MQHFSQIVLRVCTLVLFIICELSVRIFIQYGCIEFNTLSDLTKCLGFRNRRVGNTDTVVALSLHVRTQVLTSKLYIIHK